MKPEAQSSLPSSATVKELQDELRARGLPVAGRKAELEQRLQESACESDDEEEASVVAYFNLREASSKTSCMEQLKNIIRCKHIDRSEELGVEGGLYITFLQASGSDIVVFCSDLVAFLLDEFMS